jgi:hypothetical protein
LRKLGRLIATKNECAPCPRTKAHMTFDIAQLSGDSD